MMPSHFTDTTPCFRPTTPVKGGLPTRKALDVLPLICRQRCEPFFYRRGKTPKLASPAWHVFPGSCCTVAT